MNGGARCDTMITCDVDIAAPCPARSAETRQIDEYQDFVRSDAGTRMSLLSVQPRFTPGYNDSFLTRRIKSTIESIGRIEG